MKSVFHWLKRRNINIIAKMLYRSLGPDQAAVPLLNFLEEHILRRRVSKKTQVFFSLYHQARLVDKNSVVGRLF